MALTLAVVPGKALAMSLSEAVRQAVATSPEMAEARAEREAIRGELDAARALYRPTLDVEAFVGPNYVDRPNSLRATDNGETRLSRQVGVTASWTLFDGYFRANEMFRQATRIEGAGYRVLEAGERVALDTIEAYVDVLRHRRVLAAADVNIAHHRMILGRAQNQYEGGAATRGEVEIAGERLASAEALRAEVLRALGEVEASFVRLVGAEPQALGAAPLPRGLPGSLSAALSAARAGHPTLFAATTDITALEAETEQTTSGLFPTLSLQGRGVYGFDTDGTPGPSSQLSGNVVLNWRLYDGGLRQARRHEAEERRSAAEIRRERYVRDIEQAVRRAWSDMGSNDVRLAALRRRLTQAERVVAAYEEEYEAGLRSLLDILDAQNARFNAEFEVASAEAIAVFARYQVIGATGALLDQFAIASERPEPGDAGANLRLHRTGSLLEPLRR
ncbi:MAG: TolC family outer membrane protein [Hyphomicrobiaceae bacterium]|nr:TolC family outer membrane protein [Hyphomicrobiaceae bacterium]